MEWEPGHLAVFIPMLGMVAVFALNQAVASRRTSQQIDRDTRGLQAALLAELILLRAMVADNLALIERGEEYLLSFRVLTQVYRSNVGRLTLLPEPAIDAVVSAYGTIEATEVFVGATTRPHGTHAYRVWLGDAGWKDIEPRLRAAGFATEAAIARLGPPGRYLADPTDVQPDAAPLGRHTPPTPALDVEPHASRIRLVDMPG
jgi:hypothetical protein